MDKCLQFFFHAWVVLLAGFQIAQVNSFSIVQPQIRLRLPESPALVPLGEL
jgi:hypothetical protein